MVKAVLFDLDGTLLPMDQDEFTKGYFKLLVKKLASYGYAEKSLVEAVWKGTAAMVKNDGTKSNEEAFWETFIAIYDEQARNDIPLFNEFYAHEFNGTQALCGFNPMAAEAVRRVKQAGFRVALATNPLFPEVAQVTRIRWAGLEPEDFELYTTYENSSYCKPNPNYYRDMAMRLNISPSDCLMVGNDVDEDMEAAAVAGMKVFLLADCLLNRHGRDITNYPLGGFPELISYLNL